MQHIAIIIQNIGIKISRKHTIIYFLQTTIANIMPTIINHYHLIITSNNIQQTMIIKYMIKN